MLSVEGKCSGSVGVSALVEEDRCFLLWKTSALAVETECAGRGKRVCRQRKPNVLAVEGV